MERIFSDLYLVAAIISYGLRPKKIDKSDIKRTKFVFEGPIQYIKVVDERNPEITSVIESPSLEELNLHFASQQLWFPPSYVAAIDQVKRIISEGR